MKIRVQFCWNGQYHLFRALVCGGVRVRSDKWDRATAKEMLDILAIEMPGTKRSSIRFIHV